MGAWQTTSKPAAPSEVLDDPVEGQTDVFLMAKGGCCSSGWNVKNEDGKPWLWVATGSDTLTLENFAGDELGSAEVDDEHYETTVKRTTDWQDSDSSSDDDDGFFGDMTDDDDNTVKHKLKWKCKRTVNIEAANGSGKGSVAIKIKGKAKSKVQKVEQDEGPPQIQVLENEAECKKAIFNVQWNGKVTKFKERNVQSGDISFPNAFDMDWTGGCCEETMTLNVCGGDIPAPMVPLMAAVVVEHLHPVRLAAEMQNTALNEAMIMVRNQ